MTTAKKTVDLVFAGYRADIGAKKRWMIFYKLQEHDRIDYGDAWRFPDSRGMRRVGLGRPGGKWRFDVKDGTNDGVTILPSTAKPLGRWGDEDQIATWQIEHESAVASYSARSSMKTAERANLECLDPIRKAWRDARGLQRNVILARAVAYITGHG